MVYAAIQHVLNSQNISLRVLTQMRIYVDKQCVPILQHKLLQIFDCRLRAAVRGDILIN